jgi:hypothetical protein
LLPSLPANRRAGTFDSIGVVGVGIKVIDVAFRNESPAVSGNLDAGKRDATLT